MYIKNSDVRTINQIPWAIFWSLSQKKCLTWMIYTGGIIVLVWITVGDSERRSLVIGKNKVFFIVWGRNISCLSCFHPSALNCFYDQGLILIVRQYWLARNYRTRNEREILHDAAVMAHWCIFQIKFRSYFEFLLH